MEACLEALLEMDFCSKPPNFGVEVHMEAPAGDALTDVFRCRPLVRPPLPSLLRCRWYHLSSAVAALSSRLSA
jgi:hypothetical protein